MQSAPSKPGWLHRARNALLTAFMITMIPMFVSAGLGWIWVVLAGVGVLIVCGIGVIAIQIALWATESVTRR
jgi:hypothetical protein